MLRAVVFMFFVFQFIVTDIGPAASTLLLPHVWQRREIILELLRPYRSTDTNSKWQIDPECFKFGIVAETEQK